MSFAERSYIYAFASEQSAVVNILFVEGIFYVVCLIMQNGL